jgi:hypothetical protein
MSSVGKEKHVMPRMAALWVLLLLFGAPVVAFAQLIVTGTGTVGKATELAGPITVCPAGQAARGIDTFGNSVNCFTAGGGKAVALAGPGSPIAGPDVGTIDQVHISDLNTSPTDFAAPLNPFNGAWLTYSIYSATARALTWNAVFSAEAGPPLPNISLGGAYLVLTFRFNTLSNKWALVWTSRELPFATQLTESSGIVGPINCDTTRFGYLPPLTGAIQFSDPVCTPRQGQRIIYSFRSPNVQLLTWGTKYTSVYGLSLPARSTGNNMKDEFAFQYDEPNDKWDLIATTQNARASRLKTCHLGIGEDNGPALSDTQLGPQTRMCEPIGTNGTIVEVAIWSNAGTPSVLPHKETGGVQTNLLSGALSTAAGGRRACARVVAELSENGSNTCVATLVSGQTAYVGEVMFGFTSGTAGGVAKSLTVIVYYLPGS